MRRSRSCCTYSTRTELFCIVLEAVVKDRSVFLDNVPFACICGPDAEDQLEEAWVHSFFFIFTNLQSALTEYARSCRIRLRYRVK